MTTAGGYEQRAGRLKEKEALYAIHKSYMIATVGWALP
jgi:hypothetical protein